MAERELLSYSLVSNNVHYFYSFTYVYAILELIHVIMVHIPVYPQILGTSLSAPGLIYPSPSCPQTKSWWP